MEDSKQNRQVSKPKKETQQDNDISFLALTSSVCQRTQESDTDTSHVHTFTFR